MQEFWTFSGVIALWLLASAALWRLGRWLTRRQQRRLAAELARMCERAEEAQGVFDLIRCSGNHTAGDTAAAREATLALLRRIQEAGWFFDAVTSQRQAVLRRLNVAECAPLAEILHMRRDLWAASEIILAEDMQTLGGAFAEAGSYERFRHEALDLLFKGGPDDLMDLRLSMARTEAAQLVRDVENETRHVEEQERLPTLREIIAFQAAAVTAVPEYARAFGAQVMETARQIREKARAVRESETVAGAIGECSRQYTRAREELPGRLAAALEGAGALAHTGRERISAHYAFLVKAYRLQEKYEEALRRAPELTERGRQFITRIELKHKAERLMEMSHGLAGRLRPLLVKGLAHMIAALQRLQDKLAHTETARRERPLRPARDTARREETGVSGLRRMEPGIEAAGRLASGSFGFLYRVLRLGPMTEEERQARWKDRENPAGSGARAAGQQTAASQVESSRRRANSLSGRLRAVEAAGAGSGAPDDAEDRPPPKLKRRG